MDSRWASKTKGSGKTKTDRYCNGRFMKGWCVHQRVGYIKRVNRMTIAG